MPQLPLPLPLAKLALQQEQQEQQHQGQQEQQLVPRLAAKTANYRLACCCIKLKRSNTTTELLRDLVDNGCTCSSITMQGSSWALLHCFCAPRRSLLQHHNFFCPLGLVNDIEVELPQNETSGQNESDGSHSLAPNCFHKSAFFHCLCVYLVNLCEKVWFFRLHARFFLQPSSSFSFPPHPLNPTQCSSKHLFSLTACVF
mmetsp:Transcript_34658/g.68381  ORF Transcript_34658/g.68381 Transcript_34658/m.68381 type:complete len:200 (-) Transcript_34658:265-864(-)